MKDLQKKVYHKNRFYSSPMVIKESPSDTKFAKIFNHIKTNINILESYVQIDNLIVYIDNKDINKTLVYFKNIGFDILTDMSAIHMKNNTFEIFYQLLNIDEVLRIRIKTNVISHIESISSVYRNAIWCEREIYDMFGVKFNNHPALKRLIMPDDWSGHPLRKDYPLQGDEKAQWYEVDKIFGKDYRCEIGPENRNPSYIDPDDTFNFAHMEYEVPKGTPPSNKTNDINYQEDDGIFVVTRFDRQTKLEKRR